MKLVALFLGLALANPAGADFSGKWAGQGKLGRGGEDTACETITLDVEQGDGFVDFVAGHIKCGKYESILEPMRFDVSLGRLFFENRVVGFVNNARLHAEVMVNGVMRVYDMLRRDDGALYIQMQVMQENLTTLLTADLYRQLPMAMKMDAEFLDCDSAWNHMQVYRYGDDKAYISWTSKIAPGGNPITRNAEYTRHPTKDLGVFTFPDGVLYVDGALLREEMLSGAAVVDYPDGRWENYRCLRR